MARSFRFAPLLIAFALSACESAVEPTLEPEPGPAVRIVVRADILRIAEGDSTRIVATAIDSAGRTVARVPLAFSVDEWPIVSVSDSGWVHALKPGWSMVHVSSGSMRDSLWVAVSMHFASVIAGASHACGITAQHELYCWGTDNKYSPGSIKYREPIQTATLQATDVAFYASGYYHACYTTTSNSTHCWGRDYEGERGDGPAIGAPLQAVQLPEPLISLSSSDWTTCGVTASQRVFCWGENISGELGTGPEPGSLTGTECGFQPCRTSPFEVPGMRLKSVSSGVSHTCGLDADGRAFCWGDNDAGQLGVDSVGGIIKPSAVNTTVRFKTIVAGYSRTCALSMNDAAYCWGGGPHLTKPTEVTATIKFKSLSVLSSACGVSDVGKLYCWSDDAPVAVVPEVTFKSVSMGWYINCALSTQEAAYCWGTTTYVGTGFPARNYPIMIAPPGPVPAMGQ